MFTPELQRSIRTSSQNTSGSQSCLTPLSSSTPRRKSVGHVPLSTSWGSSPHTRNAIQDVNKQPSGYFSLPRRSSLSTNLERSVLSRSMARIPSTDEDSVFMNKEVTFQDSIHGSIQSLNKYEPSQLYVFDDTAQQQNSLVCSSSSVEFEQTLFERTAFRHARRLRLQEEVTELCQETALMQEKTAKLMANTARVRRLRIQLDMDLLDVDSLCMSGKRSKELEGGPSGAHDETNAVSDDKIYHEIDAVGFTQKRHYDDEKENRTVSSPSTKRQLSNSQVQTNRASKLRSNSIRRQRGGHCGNILQEKPPVIPRHKKPDIKRSKSDLYSREASAHSQSRVSLKEKHLDQDQEKDQAEKAATEKPVKQGFQMKLKKVSKKFTTSRLSFDKKVDINVESTWL